MEVHLCSSKQVRMCSHSEWCRASVATLCWHRNCPSHLPSSTTRPLHCVCIGVSSSTHCMQHAACNMYTTHIHVYYTLNVHTLYIAWNVYTTRIACNMYTINITFNIYTIHIAYVHNTQHMYTIHVACTVHTAATSVQCAMYIPHSCDNSWYVRLLRWQQALRTCPDVICRFVTGCFNSGPYNWPGRLTGWLWCDDITTAFYELPNLITVGVDLWKCMRICSFDQHHCLM